MEITLEICTNSIASALAAAKAGAPRIELCENLWEGGTTPSHGTLAMVRNRTDLEIMVLVRPRGGDFVYSEEEFLVMLADIDHLKEVGAHGVVSGVLLPDGQVDIPRTRALVEHSHPLPFVFHRAFDLTPDPFQALEDVISTGARRILSSGQQPKALDGLPLIQQLHARASGRIELLPGGGLHAEGMEAFIRQTPIRQFHFTAKAPVENFPTPGPQIAMNGSPSIPENVRFQSNENIIRETLHRLSILLK
jgi:copper homeostasis protein